jgi:hypothetical protein
MLRLFNRGPRNSAALRAPLQPVMYAAFAAVLSTALFAPHPLSSRPLILL